MTRKSLGINVGRATSRTLAIGSGVVLLAGCQFGGLNSLNMPGTAGHGSGAYSITVELPDVATLPQNSPVMVDDVTVGSVSGVEAVQRADGSFYAAVKVSLDRDVKLPANATAKVAQTSLLGSQHIELSAPVDQPPVGELRDGSELPRSQGGRYPTTEEVLSALGVVVNKGNLGALQDITQEVSNAVAGRQGQFADLIPRLAELTASLNRQTDDIIAAAEGLNRFAGVLARNKDSLGRALDTLPDALRVLNDNRDQHRRRVRCATEFRHGGRRASSRRPRMISPRTSRTSTRSSSRSTTIVPPSCPTWTAWRPSRSRVRTWSEWPGAITSISSLTFDLTIRRLGETIFTTSFFDPNMKHLDEVVNPPDFLAGEMANLSGQAADPFKIPPGTASGQEVPPE